MGTHGELQLVGKGNSVEGSHLLEVFGQVVDINRVFHLESNPCTLSLGPFHGQQKKPRHDGYGHTGKDAEIMCQKEGPAI